MRSVLISGYRLSLAVLLLLLLASGLQAEPDKKIPQRLVTEDGLELHAWLTPSSAQVPAPLLVVLPMRGRDHTSYESLIEALHERLSSNNSGTKHVCPHVLSIDLRGEGQSVSKGTDSIDWRRMSNGQYRRIPKDIAAMITQVLESGEVDVDRKQIWIVGSALGANAAAFLPEEVKGISKVALISPGRNRRGLKPLEPVGSFDGDVLIFASEEDRYARQSSAQIVDNLPRPIAIELFDGSNRGTDILANNRVALDRLVSWLVD